MQAMRHRLATLAGRAAYAIRKQTVEPVFGIIKSVMGFRQFFLRGLRKVTGEWNLVCLAWNVKRIGPAAFRPGALARENYTTLLWAFAGFPSYYDDLALLRSGGIDAQAYIELIGKTIAKVECGAGRLKQRVAEASFDAWIKQYRPDENSVNTSNDSRPRSSPPLVSTVNRRVRDSSRYPTKAISSTALILPPQPPPRPFMMTSTQPLPNRASAPRMPACKSWPLRPPPKWNTSFLFCSRHNS